MSDSRATDEPLTKVDQTPERGVWDRILNGLRYWNNLLLAPLFVQMAVETSFGTPTTVSQPADDRALELFFCVSFFAEWMLSFALAPDKRTFLRDPANIIDLISSMPLSYVKSVRLVRLVRLVRVLRLAIRARRYRGKGSKLIRAAGLVGSITFSGAVAFRIVEPHSTAGFEEALWWSLVTLSTVGYGDIMPTTPAGHLVAALIIISGLGAIGYTAGFMTSLIQDDDDDESDNELRMRLRAIDDQLAQIQAGLAKLANEQAVPAETPANDTGEHQASLRGAGAR